MGRPIVRIEREGHEPVYLEWSTVVDAPISFGMTREEMRRALLEDARLRFDEEIGAKIDARLARCDSRGTSSMVEPDAEATMFVNRAGANETPMTIDEIVHWYVDLKREPDVEGTADYGDEQ